MLLQSDPFKFLQFQEGSIYDRISPKLKSNLATGARIEFDPHREHFCYSRETIFLGLKYILENDDLLPIYTNSSFRENINCYLETFIVPNLHKPPVDVAFEFASPSTPKEPFTLHECVFVHGRFNGVPHPGYIRTLRYLQDNSDFPITLGIETDAYSISSGQYPFADVIFRASMLWYTGWINRLVIIEAPFHETEDPETVFDYWDNMYGIDTFVINPQVLVAHGSEEYWRKEERAPMRLNIRTVDMLLVDGLQEFHMSDLRNNSLTPDQVRDCWEIAMG